MPWRNKQLITNRPELWGLPAGFVHSLRWLYSGMLPQEDVLAPAAHPFLLSLFIFLLVGVCHPQNTRKMPSLSPKNMPPGEGDAVAGAQRL